MVPFAVFLVATLLFRGLGAGGVARFAQWRVSAAHGLSVMLLVTAAAHFVPSSVTVMPNHADMVALVPPQVPFPEVAVIATGGLEVAAAVGLVMDRTRRWAGMGIALLFLVMFPANVYAALDPAQVDATPLWIRAPQQAVYVAVALWVAGATRWMPRTGQRRASDTADDPATAAVGSVRQ
ncbi:hypothetical protein J4H86_13300 [Spiractinospora alimapuensis]|uniref:DoxX family protein n=1 Tax=Spiractinospora alimapuensis TaxID=2820884 RepID=UPI001F35276F|nr:hypothetical protein [Spiractinospora alimapuensis]QVQ54546.1 hypothetical protein J4H86_13300 [Spiractinospora alimapuensis]